MTGNLSHWMHKTESISLGEGNTSGVQIYKSNLAALPVLVWTLTENADETFTIRVDYSYDNVTYANLVSDAAGKENGNTVTTDLAAVSSGVPGNAPYLKITLTANSALEAGETATLTVDFIKWLTDQGEDVLEHGSVTLA